MKMKKRFLHSLSHYVNVSGNMGLVLPVGLIETIPGDTFNHSYSVLLRMASLLSPVMHPVKVSVTHWHIPWRIVFDGWDEFITGSDTGYNLMSQTIPAYAANNRLIEMLGATQATTGTSISCLPGRAYKKLIADRFLDMHIQGTSNRDWFNSNKDTQGLNYATNLRDIFNTSRETPDANEQLFSIPVSGIGVPSTSSWPFSSAVIHETGGSGNESYASGVVSTGSSPDYIAVEEDPNNSGFPGIFADMDLNLFKDALGRHRFEERMLKYGNRYSEYLMSLGIRPNDARVNEPEFLGGGSTTVSFNEIVQTGVDSTDSGVGNLAGHGLAALRTKPYRKFFTEFGCVLSVMVMRPVTIYGDGIHRLFLKNTKEDFFQEELENIGMQPVYDLELYHGAAQPTDVFGYAPNYYEYRQVPNRAGCDFRAGYDDYSLAYLFASQPTPADLTTADFSTEVARIKADSNEEDFKIMGFHNCHARRRVHNTR